ASFCSSANYHYFFSTTPAPTEIYTLSLHDALPISSIAVCQGDFFSPMKSFTNCVFGCSINCCGVSTCTILPSFIKQTLSPKAMRSEEHTSELQSRFDLVCRLLLEKKKKQ